MDAIRDPAPQLRAATVFGRLVGAGLLDEDECLPKLTAAAARAAPGRDPAGLAMRLAWRLREAAAEMRRARATAARALTAAIAPLLDALAPAEAILEAARAANERAGTVLRGAEVEMLAAEAVRIWLRRNRPALLGTKTGGGRPGR